MRRKITDLREQRASLFEQMKAISEGAEAEGRDLNAEETTNYERMSGEFDTLSSRVERLEREAGIAPEMTRDVALAEQRAAELAERESGGKPVVESRAGMLVGRIMRSVNGDNEAVEELRDMAKRVGAASLRSRAEKGDEDAKRLYFATDEYREGFEAYIRTFDGKLGYLSEEQRAAFAVGTGSLGGFTVPVEFLNQLVVRLREFGVVRQLATVITTAGSGDLQIPRVASTRATAAWTAEAGAYTESEDTFEQIILKSYKAAVIAKASEEMVHDSAFDVLGWIARSSGEALGILENTAFQTGANASTTTPEGLMTKATAGVTLTNATGNVTTITSADSFIDLYHSVLKPYRARGSWLMNDATVKIGRKLKDTTNQYIWSPGLIAGEPDTILGRPLYTDPDIAVAAASARTVAFGDIESAYMVRDVEGVAAQVLSELYAANGQVGFRIHKRTDGDLIDDTAVKVLVQAAS